MSAIYFSRCIDYTGMKKGDVFNIDLFVDGELYPVYLRYMGKENFKTEFGTFRCTKFAPLLLESNAFKGGEDMVIYTTDDENRLPIYIELKLSVGYAKIYLDKNGYKGLRHPMTSKVS